MGVLGTLLVVRLANQRRLKEKPLSVATAFSLGMHCKQTGEVPDQDLILQIRDGRIVPKEDQIGVAQIHGKQQGSLDTIHMSVF